MCGGGGGGEGRWQRRLGTIQGTGGDWRGGIEIEKGGLVKEKKKEDKYKFKH